MEFKRIAYHQSPEYAELYNPDTNDLSRSASYLSTNVRTRAFEYEFWIQLQKAYAKLRNYNYTTSQEESLSRGAISEQQGYLLN